MWPRTAVISPTVILSLLAAPLTAAAQQPAKVPRIGGLFPGTPASAALPLDAFWQGMRELGYVEGRNVLIEYRWAEGAMARLPALAAELVQRRVDLILTSSTPASLAAKEATSTIPVVFAASSDPVGAGVVASLAHPGGNVTGFSVLAPELSGKRLELLRETVLWVASVAILWDVSNVGMAERVRETRAAAGILKLRFHSQGARDLAELEQAFATLARERPDALLVTAEPFTVQQRRRIRDFVTQQRLPTMYEERRFVDAGGLMSYGPSVLDNFRRAATYVDKILRGAKPGDLPVEQPTRFELVVNLKTAKALGLTIPQSVLIRADQVIQ